MPKLSVVVPVYYNAESLPPLFEKLQAVERQLHQLGLDLELIFVDDGSGDASFQALQAIKAQRPATRLVKLSRNFGAMRACKAGAQFVTGDCFSFLAADLQDPPELLVEMAARWQQGAKFVLCTRAERDDPLLSRLWAALYYRLLRLLVLPSFPPGGYDLALMDQALLPHLLQSGRTAHLQVSLFWLGFRPEIIAYKRLKREHGRSHWSFAKRLTASLDVLLGFSVVPIRLISLLGLGVSLASFSYGAVVIVAALMGIRPVPGFASLAALISFLLGLIIVMLGVIGEYLWRIFEEVNHRPEAVIDEVL